jgi:hypothetical protein
VHLTSEQIHWILGGIIVVIAVLWLLYKSGVVPSPHVRYAIPLGLCALGLETFVDPILHGSVTVHSPHETRQHVAMGVLAFAAGAVEFFRLKGRMKHRAWGLVFPSVLGIIGFLFLFHSQHGGPGPALVLTVQHRFMGITLLLAGIMKALEETSSQRTEAFNVSWAVLLLLFGLEFIFYSEGGSIFGGTIYASPADSSHAH